MSYATIDDLRSQLGRPPALSPDYAARMLHDLPEGACLDDRNAWICGRVKDKVVLDIGASGKLHERITKVARSVFGIDRQDSVGVVGFDLDDVTCLSIPVPEPPDIVVCGEVLEHLSNPGHLLARLHRQLPGVPVIITVPNAYSSVSQKHLRHDRENVNIDHVAWYSPRTLRTLVERVGYRITEFAYYNGDGPTSEGLIAVVE